MDLLLLPLLVLLVLLLLLYVFQQLGSEPKAVLSSLAVGCSSAAPRVPRTTRSGSPSKWKNEFPSK